MEADIQSVVTSEEVKTPRTLNDIYDVLVEIRDGLGVTTQAVVDQNVKPAGITLEGTDAGKPNGVDGQGVSSGVSNSLHVS